VALVRRRRPQPATAQAHPKSREPARRKVVDLAAGMDVVEGPLTGTHAAALLGARPAATADLKDLDTSSLDFDVGAAIAPNEAEEESTTPAPVSNAADEAPAEAATVRMAPDPATEATARQQRPAPERDRALAPIDDEKHTLTIVELDMLREDYEAEHTLTQQGSQALRDALADLATTRAAHTATAETATLESPVADVSDSTIDAPTARLRSK
jgi:hypothetical protein